MVDAPEGASGGGVEEDEKAPQSRLVPLTCTWLRGFRAVRAPRAQRAEYSSPGGVGDGPRGLDNERPERQGFLDEVREALDGRVRGEMLRWKPLKSACAPKNTVQWAAIAGRLLIGDARPTPRNKEPPNFGRGKVLSVASSSEGLGFDYTSSNQSPAFYTPKDRYRH